MGVGSYLCIVDEALVHTMPKAHQTRPQFANAVATDALTACTYLVIPDYGAIQQPQIWRNKSGCCLIKKLQCHVRSQCASVTSC